MKEYIMKVRKGAYLIGYTTAKGWGSTEVIVHKRTEYEDFKKVLKEQIAQQTLEPFIIVVISHVAKKGWL
jgi:hypothetical protein